MQTNKQTDKQTPLKTSTSLRYATQVGKHYLFRHLYRPTTERVEDIEKEILTRAHEMLFRAHDVSAYPFAGPVVRGFGTVCACFGALLDLDAFNN